VNQENVMLVEEAANDPCWFCVTNCHKMRVIVEFNRPAYVVDVVEFNRRHV
jgi:hypothetical protein